MKKSILKEVGREAKNMEKESMLIKLRGYYSKELGKWECDMVLDKKKGLMEPNLI